MAGQYGILLDFSSNGVAEMKKLQAEMKAMQAQQKATTVTVEETNKEMGESFKELKATIIEAFAVREIFEFGKELLHVTAEFQGFDNVIKYSSLNTIDAQQNLSFLKNTINDLKLPMEQAYKGFSEMQAGLQGTGIEGEKLRNFFKGFSTMAMVQHLDPAKYDRALYDLKEIGEIGLNKRMERSLMINLTGIGKVVKETFGKSMAELQKDGMGGAEFLDKLGQGMQKVFAPGKDNALHSLQAEMAATQNSMTQGMLDMGKNLEPVFIEIMHSIQGAFNSAPVQYFIKNIKEIVQLVGLAAETFIIYKGIMLSATVVTWGYEAALKAVEIAEYGATFGVEGLTVAAEGLGAAFASIGLGAFSLLIATMINDFSTWNKEMDDSIQSITHLNELQAKGKEATSAYNEDVLNFKEYQGGKLSKDEAGETYTKIGQDIKTTSKLVTDLQMRLDQSKSAFANLPTGFNEFDESGVESLEAQRYRNAKKQVDDLQKEFSQASKHLTDLNFGQKYMADHGVKPPNYQDLGNGVNGNAANSSDLSGAKGGLSEAKVINIHIDNVQRIDKVEAGSDWKRQSQSAGEQIMREINNLSLSQSSSF